jgi:transposase
MSNILTLEEMHNMSIDEIVNLYRNGYTIEENVNYLEPKIVSADVSISTGSLLLVGAGILAYMFLIRK